MRDQAAADNAAAERLEKAAAERAAAERAAEKAAAADAARAKAAAEIAAALQVTVTAHVPEDAVDPCYDLDVWWSPRPSSASWEVQPNPLQGPTPF